MAGHPIHKDEIIEVEGALGAGAGATGAKLRPFAIGNADDYLH